MWFMPSKAWYVTNAPRLKPYLARRNFLWPQSLIVISLFLWTSSHTLFIINLVTYWPSQIMETCSFVVPSYPIDPLWLLSTTSIRSGFHSSTLLVLLLLTVALILPLKKYETTSSPFSLNCPPSILRPFGHSGLTNDVISFYTRHLIVYCSNETATPVSTTWFCSVTLA